MYELYQVGENTFYIDCPAKMGVYRVAPDEAVLIDSGNDREAGKKVLKIFDAQGWRLKALYNTHSNADHIGGNRLLADRTGCAVYGAEIENAFTRDPVLEPSFLFGGYPPKELRSKFLMAQPSSPQPLTPETLPPGMSSFSLPGHFFGMVGFATDDGVCFLADCLSGENILEKYHVSFIYDVRRIWKRWTGWRRCRHGCSCPPTRRPRRTSGPWCAPTGKRSARWPRASRRFAARRRTMKRCCGRCSKVMI